MTRANTGIKIHQQTIAFLSFWQDIAAHIGDLDLPLPDQPKKLQDITVELDSYFNPLKQCLIDVYRLNNCRNLNSLIKPIVVLDVLGEQCFHLKNDVVDVKDIDLLEDLGVYISQKYIRIQRETQGIRGASTANNTTHNAQIIRLDWYKTRKANGKR